MKRLITLLVPIITLLPAPAREYKLEGKVGGKYSIVVELTKEDDGYVTGRYAYRSTLKSKGDTQCSWLYIFPEDGNQPSTWKVLDCDYSRQETWTNVRFNGTTLSARMKNAKGRVYDIEAAVIGAKGATADPDAYFRSHLGDYPFEMGLFTDPVIQSRLQSMMGKSNYDFLVGMFQSQAPIEYHSGMYWSLGFVSHECCDPYAIWAYNTRYGEFYVWIRKDDREYWWTENSKNDIPYEFKELVRSSS